ncbi:MAG: L-serine ammonia-lyase, iron-sulfur-dependent subunit beta [Lachnospiraceae bacterium]|nr:L-serine ammonia-lyase, iron-sulfur-dependent subunit beta [Lachnospiraceae bacterium]
MANISVFDVIGPAMVGPSSSHTAGAATIGYLAGRLAGGDLSEVVFTLHGSFASTYLGHGTDRALLGGVLGFAPDDLRIRESFAIAKQRGIAFRFETAEDDDPDIHPNTADIRMTCRNGRVRTVRGVSVGGGKVRIVRIDGIHVRFSGEYETLVVLHRDMPGVVAHVTGILSAAGVNIAYMRLYREQKSEKAYLIVESDEKIPPELIDRVREHPAVSDTMLLEV